MAQGSVPFHREEEEEGLEAFFSYRRVGFAAVGSVHVECNL